MYRIVPAGDPMEGAPFVPNSKSGSTFSHSHRGGLFCAILMSFAYNAHALADKVATKQSKHEQKEERERQKQEEKQKKKEARQQQELQEQLEKQKRKEAKQLKEQQEQEEKQRKKQQKKQVHLLSLLIETCCSIVLHGTVPPSPLPVSPASPLPPSSLSLPSPLPPFPSPLPKP